MLSQDLNLEVKPASWIGLDFENGSLTFVAEKTEATTIPQIKEFNTTFASIVEKRPAGLLRRTTIAQYAKIADPIEPQEAVSFGLYVPTRSPGRESQSADLMFLQTEYNYSLATPNLWLQLTKAEALAIAAEVQATIRAYGSLQGTIHSLFLGAKPAYFNLRELSTGALVKCVYKPAVYAEIAAALQRRNAVLHVYGYTSTDLIERKIEEMEVARVDLADIVSDTEFEQLFGSNPRFTGNLTTQEFMNYTRGRGN